MVTKQEVPFIIRKFDISHIWSARNRNWTSYMNKWSTTFLQGPITAVCLNYYHHLLNYTFYWKFCLPSSAWSSTHVGCITIAILHFIINKEYLPKPTYIYLYRHHKLTCHYLFYPLPFMLSFTFLTYILKQKQLYLLVHAYSKTQSVILYLPYIYINNVPNTYLNFPLVYCWFFWHKCTFTILKKQMKYFLILTWRHTWRVIKAATKNLRF